MKSVPATAAATALLTAFALAGCTAKEAKTFGISGESTVESSVRRKSRSLSDVVNAVTVSA